MRAVLSKENGEKNKYGPDVREKLWTFFRFSSASEENLPPFLTKFACLFFARRSRCVSSRVQVCRSGHALVHRALSEFEILAFTLHY